MKQPGGKIRNGAVAILGLIALSISILVTVRFAHAQLADSPWPMFAHDAQHTGRSPYDTSTNPGTLKWKVPLLSFPFNGDYSAHEAASSPVIGVDGTIYIGSYDGNLYAFNPDGTPKWAFPTYLAGWPHKPTPIYSVPAVGADGTIYVASFYQGGYGSLYAANPDGTQKWITGTSYFEAPLTIGPDGTIYATDFELVMTFSPNGLRQIGSQLLLESPAAPAIGPDGIVYAEGTRQLGAFNPSLTQSWSFPFGYGSNLSYPSVSPSIAADGTIYAGSMNAGDFDMLYAVNPDGSEKWSFPPGGNPGHLSMTSTPVIGSDGTIYFGSDDGNLYAMNSGGTQKWSFKTDSSIFSTAAIGADGTIYFGAGNHFYALNPDGTQKWVFPVNGVIFPSPAIAADGTVYFSDWEEGNGVLGPGGYLYALGTSATPPATSIALASSLSFGNLALNDTLTKSVTIKNTGAHPLFIDGVTSTDAVQFPPGASTCPVGGVAPGATCAISVTFHPNTLGPLSAIVTLTDNANTGTQTVAVSGTGIADLTTSVASLSWGNVPFGYSIPLANFCANGLCLYNHQNVPVNLSESITGPNAADFKVTGGSCGATLGAAISGTTPTACSLAVTFTPGALGSESATLNVSDSPDASSPYHIPLSAAGTIPDTIWPLSLAYGNVSQASSQTLAAYVINNSPLTISLSDGISGPNASDFTITGGTCGATLAGKTTCSILVKFKPTSAAPESATLGIGVNQDPTSPHNVALSGTGT
ncbi:MAG TPA: choice-of-anchor D domain-containing protein [Candidatus Binataceae bacterium]|nr:choice-of-anchor D domain-containing protein [Candidatus Binataceae bacterium]